MTGIQELPAAFAHYKESLRQTGNPKAVQDQLRHKSALMTLRYLKTLSHEESLQIQQGVEFQW